MWDGKDCRFLRMDALPLLLADRQANDKGKAH
jgi:hypothetical protein